MMKSSYQKIAVVVAVGCFQFFGVNSALVNGQTKKSSTASAVPPVAASKAKKASEKAKDDSKPAAPAKQKTAAVKLIAKLVVKTAEKNKPPIAVKAALEPKQTNQKSATVPKASSQVIVTVTSARLRSEPDLTSEIKSTLNIGAVLSVLDVKSGWYQVKSADASGGGWISGTVVMDFNAGKRMEIHRAITDKYFKSKDLDFTTASQLVELLKSDSSNISGEIAAELSFKRLRALNSALKAIDLNKKDENPYKKFINSYKSEIVFSEPTKEWYIRPEVFWELHSQAKNTSIGEDIAWQAANNPLAGECEGYINCHLYKIRVTSGEYLNFYPGGKYSRKALQDIGNLLEPMVADRKEKTVYTAASDISDRAEFNRYLAELRTIVSRVPYIEKSRTINQINQLGEGYR